MALSQKRRVILKLIKSLGTIAQEGAKCRAAFKRSKINDIAWHCHHENMCEPLYLSALLRIRHIVKEKPNYEVPLRLRLFRPVKYKKFKTVYEGDCNDKQYNKLMMQRHAIECPVCTWDGDSILPSWVRTRLPTPKV